MKKNASLVLVGCGLKFLSHLTIEAKAYILQSEKVLYLVNNPAMKVWIQKNSNNSESLDNLYFNDSSRVDCYQAISTYILQILRKNIHLCVVIYGHPTIFSKPGVDAVIEAKKEGFYAKILPGISAEDCLFADLLINPSYCGCLSYEATDLILARRPIDTRCHVVIWQLGNIGMIDHMKNECVKNLNLFMNYLYQFYPPEYEVILYEAAQYPMLDPVINKIALKDIEYSLLSKITTLYVPPSKKTVYDPNIIEEFNLQSYFNL